MANQLPRSGGSKDKDDDSWGKLASDLFGIQFGGASDDDDFDLTDDEPTPQAPAAPAPSILEATPASRPVVEEEPDVSFPEDDDVAPVAAVEVVAKSVEIEAAVDEVEPEEARDPRDESEKDIWDLLESWNWDEPNRESRAASGESRPSGSSGRRSEGDKPSGGRREDRGSRRDSSRSERPRRSSESESSDAPREARPRREDRPRRSERSGESRPPRAERPARTEPVVDEFSSGIDEPVRPAATERPASPTRPRPAARVEADDFEGDLFTEPTQADVAPEAGGTADEAEGNGEPRRRRRRRRRGNRDRVRQDDAPVADDVDEIAESSDVTDDVSEPEEPVAADDEGDAEPRRRRRRRRPRRRGEEAPVRTEAASPSQDVEESDADDESEAGFAESDGDNEEAPVAVSYEGIPSWEEAISYLQRRPRDPRQRDGSSRGRGNHRR